VACHKVMHLQITDPRTQGRSHNDTQSPAEPECRGFLEECVEDMYLESVMVLKRAYYKGRYIATSFRKSLYFFFF
jgi:hypothetical protein